MLWVLIFIVIVAVVVAEIVDRRHGYSVGKTAKSAPRAIQGVPIGQSTKYRSPTATTLPVAFEFLFDDEASED